MERQDILTMSVREIDKLKVIHEVLQKRLKQRQAARQLGLGTRQVIRLCKRVRREGNRGLIWGEPLTVDRQVSHRAAVQVSWF